MLLNELKIEFMSARETGGKQGGSYPPTFKTALLTVASRRYSKFQRAAVGAAPDVRRRHTASRKATSASSGVRRRRIGLCKNALVTATDITIGEKGSGNGIQTDAAAATAIAVTTPERTANASAAAAAATTGSGKKQESRRVVGATDPVSSTLSNERTAASHRGNDERRRTCSLYGSDAESRTANEIVAAAGVAAATAETGAAPRGLLRGNTATSGLAGASATIALAGASATTATVGRAKPLALQRSHDPPAGGAVAADRDYPRADAAAMAVASRSYRAAYWAFNSATNNHGESESPEAFIATVQAFADALSAYARTNAVYARQVCACTARYYDADSQDDVDRKALGDQGRR